MKRLTKMIWARASMSRTFELIGHSYRSSRLVQDSPCESQNDRRTFDVSGVYKTTGQKSHHSCFRQRLNEARVI